MLEKVAQVTDELQDALYEEQGKVRQLSAALQEEKRQTDKLRGNLSKSESRVEELDSTVRGNVFTFLYSTFSFTLLYF